jgi:hypothetical protein
MLDRYDEESTEAWLDTLGDDGRRGAASERSDYWNFRIWTDEDLAELVSRGGQNANTRLAEIEIRRRESWQTPARWSLVMAGLSLLVSIIALAVSLLA